MEALLINKEDYYKDNRFCSFSGLKVFSKCETLYRDLFVTKTYEEPEYDYFVYGKLVDAMVSESPEFIQKYFIRVERRIRPEDALKFENQIKTLQSEIAEKRGQIAQKIEAKCNAISEKIKALPEGSLKLAKLEQDFKDAALTPDKTLEKGITGREQEIIEIQTSLDSIKHLANKQQVTPAIWQNAEETALAIKTHPSYVAMEWNDYTSQQIFTAVIDGVPCKGKLDHLKLSLPLTNLYAIYVAGQMTLDQLQDEVRNSVHATDKWAIITDVKTCRDIASLEPYNTHYRGQLGFYRDLVSAVLFIPKENIRTRILAADKLNNDFKKCELFEYAPTALDELTPDVRAWAKIWMQRTESGQYISAKEKNGWHQKCFTCSECRFCPFSLKPGEPVLVSEARFTADSNGNKPLVEELSTAEAVLEY